MLLRPMNQYYTPKTRTIKLMNSNQIINGSYLSYERLSAKIPQIVSAGIIYRKWIRFSATSKDWIYRILEPKICENQIMCRVWTYSIHTDDSTRRWKIFQNIHWNTTVGCNVTYQKTSPGEYNHWNVNKMYELYWVSRLWFNHLHTIHIEY